MTRVEEYKKLNPMEKCCVIKVVFRIREIITDVLTNMDEDDEVFYKRKIDAVDVCTVILLLSKPKSAVYEFTKYLIDIINTIYIMNAEEMGHTLKEMEEIINVVK